MPLIRSYQEFDGVWVFDSHLDKDTATYDATHLEKLAEHEKHHFWFKHRGDKICQAFQQYVPKSARILEIGGGTGYIASKLEKLGFIVEMADIHANGLQHAKKKGISKLYRFDIYSPPFLEEFDVICLFDVLEHLHDPLKAIKCIKGMLRPNGRLILTVPAHQWLWSRDDVIAGHRQRFTRRDLKQLFHASDFKIIQLHYFFIAVLPFLLLRRWRKKDDGSALRKEEAFDLKMSLVFNYFFKLLMQAEVYLDPFLPNLAGGSLLGIAVMSPAGYKTQLPY